MIGKLIEIHPRDAFYEDRESLLGTIWKIDEMDKWDGHQEVKEITGYYSGYCNFAEPIMLEYASATPPFGEVTWKPEESNIFHAVKFEILEESGE